MKLNEIEQFVESLVHLENFLSEVAALEGDISFRGMVGKQLYGKYEEAMSSFDGFDRKLYELTRLSKLIDKDLFNQIDRIIENSKLPDAITQISVNIKIAKRRIELENSVRYAVDTTLDLMVRAISKVAKLSFKRKNGIIFDNKEISLSAVLVGLNRLIPLSQELISRINEHQKYEHEHFKPANIKVENVVLYVDDSMNIINESQEIGPETKEKLIEYLQDIKIELASKTPKWRKIVGALVIVSAILSGLAVAPQALDNVNKAVKEILGTSIEKVYPQQLPSISKDFPKVIKT